MTDKFFLELKTVHRKDKKAALKMYMDSISRSLLMLQTMGLTHDEIFEDEVMCLTCFPARMVRVTGTSITRTPVLCLDNTLENDSAYLHQFNTDISIEWYNNDLVNKFDIVKTIDDTIIHGTAATAPVITSSLPDAPPGLLIPITYVLTLQEFADASFGKATLAYVPIIQRCNLCPITSTSPAKIHKAKKHDESKSHTFNAFPDINITLLCSRSLLYFAFGACFGIVAAILGMLFAHYVDDAVANLAFLIDPNILDLKSSNGTVMVLIAYDDPVISVILDPPDTLGAKDHIIA